MDLIKESDIIKITVVGPSLAVIVDDKLVGFTNMLLEPFVLHTYKLRIIAHRRNNLDHSNQSGDLIPGLQTPDPCIRRNIAAAATEGTVEQR